jgi:putative NADH-flavin reductase
MKHSIKIAMLGSRGKAGKYILGQLLDEGYPVTALIRDPESYNFSHPLLTIVKGDIRDPQTAPILLAGCDVVISAIGQPNSEPLISSLAADHILKAMNELSIRRYIFLAGITIDVPGDNKSLRILEATKWMKDTFPLVVADKQKAYDMVNESGLDWTMIRLPFIEQTETRFGYAVNPGDCPGERISTMDLADFVITQISDQRYSGKAPFVSSL